MFRGGALIRTIEIKSNLSKTVESPLVSSHLRRVSSPVVVRTVGLDESLFCIKNDC